MATAPIGPLTWEPPYATGAALERQKKTKKKKQTNEQKTKTRRGSFSINVKMERKSEIYLHKPIKSSKRKIR